MVLSRRYTSGSTNQTNRIQGLLTGARHHAEPSRDLVTFRAPKALGDIGDVLGRLRGELYQASLSRTHAG
jgi:hypothetical protein